MTFWFTGLQSIHWATPARAGFFIGDITYTKTICWIFLIQQFWILVQITSYYLALWISMIISFSLNRRWFDNPNILLYLQQKGNCRLLKIFYLFIFRQRGRVGETEGEKHQCVVACCVPPTGDLACNPGMCPDWESNQQPFGSQAGTQSTEPHQPGQNNRLFK